jgi:hypothetical protein
MGAAGLQPPGSRSVVAILRPVDDSDGQKPPRFADPICPGLRKSGQGRYDRSNFYIALEGDLPPRRTDGATRPTHFLRAFWVPAGGLSSRKRVTRVLRLFAAGRRDIRESIYSGGIRG